MLFTNSYKLNSTLRFEIELNPNLNSTQIKTNPKEPLLKLNSTQILPIEQLKLTVLNSNSACLTKIHP